METSPYSVHYCHYNSILVINPVGRLRQLYTPFRVLQKDKEGQLKRYFVVDEVHANEQDQLFFIINGALYPHHHFIIEIQF